MAAKELEVSELFIEFRDDSLDNHEVATPQEVEVDDENEVPSELVVKFAYQEENILETL